MEKTKLLIIDDDEALCESLIDIIELEGYLVDTSYFAADGTKKVESGFYNIVLLDKKLPDSDGIVILEKIKKVSPDTEVIFFTAFAEVDTVIKAMDRNAFSFLPKPLEIPYLITTIKRALEKQKFVFEKRRLFQTISDANKDWEITFDSISDLISIHDTDFNVIKCNHAVADKFNVELKDIIGKKCYEVFHGTSEPLAACPCARCIETSRPETEEITDPHTGGTYHVTSFPRFDIKGKISGIVSIARDITEKKVAEQRLLEKEERFQDLYNNAPDMFVSVDAETAKILQCNQALAKALDYNKDEIIGQPVFFVYHPDCMEDAKKAFHSFNTTGNVSNAELQLKRKDGSKIEVILNVSAVHDEQGKILHSRLVWRDISELKKTKEKTRKLSQAIEQSPVIVIITDNEGNIEYVNPEFCKSTGYDYSEVMGKNSKILKSGETTDEEYRELWKTITSGNEWRGEFHNKKKNGELYWEAASISPLRDQEGRITHFLGVKENITERKKSEIEISKQRTLLEAINKIFKTALKCRTEREVAEMCLSMAEELTDSKYGFYGVINQDGLFDTLAVSKPGWDTCIVPKTNAVKLIKNMKIRGIDRATMKEGKPRLVNDPASHPDKVGVPKGHPPITSFMGIPMKLSGKTIGMIGLANKESDYNLDDQQAIEMLSTAFVEVLMKKRDEEALQEKEERFQTICATANDAIIMVDNDGKISYWNEAAERIFGFSKKETIGKDISNTIIPIRFRKDHLRGFKKFSETGQGAVVGKTMELTAIKKEGSEIPIELSLSSIRLNDKWNALGVIRDITDRKKAEISLLQQIQQLDALNNLSQQASSSLLFDQVVQATLDGITYAVNPDLALFFLRDGDNLNLKGIGPTNSKYKHDETPVHHVGECLCGLAVSERKPIYSNDILNDPRCTWEECKKAGLRSFAAFPLSSGDEIIGVLGVASGTLRDFSKQRLFLNTLANDVSVGLRNSLLHIQVQRHAEELETKVEERTEEFMEKADKLEKSEKALIYLLEDVNEIREDLENANKKLTELDQLKSMFIASMSHELRTPLNSIIGFTGIILQGLVGELNPKLKDHLSRANKSAKHLLSLINDIIDISKVEAKKVDTYVEEFVLDELVNEAVESIDAQVKEKGLALETGIPPGIRMNTDKRRLMQCILNYLSNAVKFTEKGVVNITVRELDREVEIIVKDTGIGISKEEQNRLFQPFTRLVSRLSTRVLGTGLGLYLTQKLATELLGGSVAVQSQPEKGSEFTLRLPKELPS